MSYLSQWVDPALVIDDAETPERITDQEVERLVKLYAIAKAARDIPRRLGSEAESEELSTDKKRCRRVAHVAGQLAATWANKPLEELRPLRDVTREAAVIDWTAWWDEHYIWLINRQRYIATWAHRNSGNERWCKSAMVRLSNELLWLEYALRD